MLLCCLFIAARAKRGLARTRAVHAFPALVNFCTPNTQPGRKEGREEDVPRSLMVTKVPVNLRVYL